MALIVKLREEVKTEKAKGREVPELKRRLQELEDAQLSEQERIAKERDDLLKERTDLLASQQETNLKLAVYGRQQALGIVDADLAIAALDRAAIEWQDGQPTNIADVLVSLLESKPILKGVPQAAHAANINAGGGQATAPAPALTAAELQAAEAMGLTAAEYHASKGVRSLADFKAAEKAARPTAQ